MAQQHLESLAVCSFPSFIALPMENKVCSVVISEGLLPKYEVDCAELKLLIVLRYIVSLFWGISHLWFIGVSYFGNNVLSVSSDLNIFSCKYSFSNALITEPYEVSDLASAIFSVVSNDKFFNCVMYIRLKFPCLLYQHQFD
jgi:hypothetical protein